MSKHEKTVMNIKGINYLQPSEQMKRVSWQELRDCLDELLDVIEKDNVGLVITKDGKDDAVLCPARWFEFNYENIDE